MLQALLRSAISESKNSCFPSKITLIVAEGREDISFKVEATEQLATVTRRHIESQDLHTAAAAVSKPHDSLGLAKLFARYFGGELETIRMGAGATQSFSYYLHLKSRGEGRERIPPILETMHGDLESMLQMS